MHLPLYLGAHTLTHLSDSPMTPATITEELLAQGATSAAWQVLRMAQNGKTQYGHIPDFQAMVTELDYALNDDHRKAQRIIKAWHAVVTSLIYYIVQQNPVPRT
ncbi:MAG: hypothetical protein ABII18_09220 [bacterium]